MIHTRDEAIARAKAWLDQQGFGERFEEVYPGGLCPDPKNGSNFPANILYQRGNGGCLGGYLLIVNRGGDDEGCVVAVENYNADTKKFKWGTGA